MKWLFLLVGLMIGFFAGGGTLIYLQDRNKDTSEMAIVFAAKSYYETEAMVLMSGTLTGQDIAYPNNSYSFACFQDRKECWVSSVEAIGPQQIGRMDSPSVYDIRKWTPYEVVAVEDGTLGCFRTTMTVQRKSQDLLWVEEPINQAQPQCKNADSKIRKYTVENSPGWKKLFGDKKGS